MPNESQIQAVVDISNQLNQSFGQCLAIVAPPIQYPQGILQSKPLQREHRVRTDLESHLCQMMDHMKQLECFFQSKIQQQEPQQESLVSIQNEIEHLEIELVEKQELMAKYTHLLESWREKGVQAQAELLQYHDE